jgi:hypothetical protein
VTLAGPLPAEQVKEPKFGRTWLWPLLLIFVLTMLGAWVLWPQSFIPTDVRQPAGGVYVLYKPTGDASREMFSPIDLSVKTWETGFPVTRSLS